MTEKVNFPFLHVFLLIKRLKKIRLSFSSLSSGTLNGTWNALSDLYVIHTDVTILVEKVMSVLKMLVAFLP